MGVRGYFKTLGILEFPASLRGSKAEGAISSKIPSKIPYYVIPQLDPRISMWNSSLMNSVLGILEFLGFLGVRGYFKTLGILEFLVEILTI